MLILSVVSCEYNADVVVRIPRWESATQAVGVLGVYPRSIAAQAEGPYLAVDCEGPPSRLAISFFLANERNEAVAAGDRISVGDTVLYPSAEGFVEPENLTQDVFVDMLTLTTGAGDPVSLLGTVEEVAWHATAVDRPPRLLLLHDHSRDAGERDDTDQRLAALSELIGEALCFETMAVNCPLPADTQLSLYRLYDDDQVNRLQQRTRDHGLLQDALDTLRNEGELGDAPHFTLPGGGEGGIPQGLSECRGSDAASLCWPAVVLIAGDVDEQRATTLDSAGLPESTRFFLAGLTDSPSLRRLACQTGGFFEEVSRLSDLRLLTNRSATEIPEYGFGFARKALLAARGRWEVVLGITGVPGDLDLHAIHRLSGTLSVRLGATPNEHTASTEFEVAIGGY
ncbi:MAG: hypothetical protein ABI333_11740 [bacterium]